jgi:hypothetical protein
MFHKIDHVIIYTQYISDCSSIIKSTFYSFYYYFVFSFMKHQTSERPFLKFHSLYALKYFKGEEFFFVRLFEEKE